MRRRGDPKASVAVGHGILLAAYRVLATSHPYHDPGPMQLRSLAAERQRRRAIHQLQELGYKVTIEPCPNAA